MRKNYINRRRHERVEVVKAIYVEVVGRGSRSEADNSVFRCETLDVSVQGLRIFVPESIAAGSTLNIVAPMGDWKENMELVGEAMWSRQAEAGEGYWIGLELRESSKDNMEKWFKVVHWLQQNKP